MSSSLPTSVTRHGFVATPVETTGARTPLLPFVARGIRFEVGGAARLDGVDLRLEPGSGCTVVMGPNGAGKSLLLRMMNGLLEPAAGTLGWNGRAPDADVRRRQSFVFQRPVLLRRSVRANLEFVLALVPGLDRAARAERGDELLARVGLADRARAPARRLSGGEQQRLALACALATAPDVLLLDEPTASLDPGSTAAIERILADVRGRGTSTVLITHDAGQARRLADTVVFLARGRVLEHTPADRFFDAPCSSGAADYLAGRLLT